MSPRHERRELPLWLGVLLRMVIALAVYALVVHTVVRPSVVPSGSMEPTIMTGDRVLIQIAGVDADRLERREVIVFAHGQTWEAERTDEPNPVMDAVRYVGDLLSAGPNHHTFTVKRIIGLPGETVSCCDEKGRVLIDGAPLEEPYVQHPLPFVAGEQDCTGSGPVPARCLPEITVPEDSYLVLGDNRANSADSVSACRGHTEDVPCTARFVRSDQVVGTLWLRWWPLPPGDALRD